MGVGVPAAMELLSVHVAGNAFMAFMTMIGLTIIAGTAAQKCNSQGSANIMLLLYILFIIVYSLAALIILFSFCWLIYKTIGYFRSGDKLRSLYCGIFLLLMIISILPK